MKTLLRSGALVMLLSAAPVVALAPVQAGAAEAASGESAFRSTTLNLAAYGETSVAPDMATISLGVDVQARTAAGAMAAGAQKMTAVIAALKSAGIAAKDIQTSGLNLSAQYAYEQNLPPRLTGYQASNQVTVLVRDLTKLGPSVDAVVGAGANQVNGISFGLSDPTAAENAARTAAVRALQAKAELYAGATGYRLQRLVSLTEGGGYAPPPPLPMARMAMAKADASTPVEAGELKVRIDINGIYELGR